MDMFGITSSNFDDYNYQLEKGTELWTNLKLQSQSGRNFGCCRGYMILSTHAKINGDQFLVSSRRFLTICL